MAKVFDDSISLGRGCTGRIKECRHGDSDWLDGEVLTPNGIVSVYSDSDHARLDFVFRGRLYMRSYPGVKMTKRGLTTVAGRFAAEVAKRGDR